jgi:hypothetical protein
VRIGLSETLEICRRGDHFACTTGLLDLIAPMYPQAFITIACTVSSRVPLSAEHEDNLLSHTEFYGEHRDPDLEGGA